MSRNYSVLKYVLMYYFTGKQGAWSFITKWNTGEKSCSYSKIKKGKGESG